MMNAITSGRRLLAASLLSLLALPAAAAGYDRIDPAASKIEFGFKQMGVSLDGKFGAFDVALKFDPAKPEAASARLELKLETIDTGSSEGNEEVKGKLWFDTASQPLAVFESKSLKKVDDNTFELAGDLTIKGRTKPIVSRFTHVTEGAGARLAGGFEIKRSDFAVGEGEWADFGMVANEVQVRYTFMALPAK